MKSVRKLLSFVALVALVLVAVAAGFALLVIVVRNPLRSIEIGAIGLVGAFVLGAIVGRLTPKVSKHTILELDLTEMPGEGGHGSKFSALRPNKKLTLHEVIETLDRASRDKKVAGLILRPKFPVASRASLDELRAAIVAFGATGKFTMASVDTFPGNSSYLLATACKEIAIQETGQLTFSQFSIERNFYPDLLSRVGVSMQAVGRGKYKSFPNMFTQRSMTPADKEQTKRMLDNFWELSAAQIGEARGITAPELSAYADKGALLASEALDASFIDRIAYPDEIVAGAKAQAGAKAKLLYLGVYKKRIGKLRPTGKSVTVAVIRASGGISDDGGPGFGLSGTDEFTPSTIVPHIRAAAEDKSVKAVVLRIDSPGGSALASDTIWRELMRLRETGKPLVASMATVAASGGYYIAAPANRIVARASSITGSIGVFGIIPEISGVKANLDVHVDEIHTGKEPPMSFNRKLSRNAKKRIDLSLDTTYATFKQRVADGRKMDLDAVEKVAQGRVWTGADAQEVGLVDDLGGLERALEIAVELTGAKPGTKAKVKPIPKKANAFASLRKKKGENSEDVPTAATLRIPSLSSLHSLTGIYTHLGDDPRSYWLR